MKKSNTLKYIILFIFVGFFLLPYVAIIPTQYNIDIDYVLLSIKLLFTSGLISLVVSLISLLFGGGLGVIISLYKIRFSKLIFFLFSITIIYPSYFLAMIYADILPSVLSTSGYIFIMSLCCIPYSFLLVYNSTNKVPSNLIHNLECLQLSHFKILIQTIIPLIKTALIMSFFISFAETFSEFGTAIFTGTNTLIVFIYKLYIGGFQTEETKFFSFFLFLIIFVLIYLLINKCNISNIEFKEINTKTLNRNYRFSTNIYVKLCVYMFCLIYFSLTVLFPFIHLFLWIKKSIKHFNIVDFGEITINTLFISFIGGLLLIILTLILSETQQKNIKERKLLITLIENSYFFPSAIIAISLLLLSIDFKFLQDYSWSLFMLAIFLKYFMIPFNLIFSNQLYLSREYELLCNIYKKNKMWYLFNVKYPLLKKGILLAFLIIQLKLIKELPLTIILRPFGIETLSTKSFYFANVELLEDSSIYFLTMLLISGLLSFFIFKINANK